MGLGSLIALYGMKKTEADPTQLCEGREGSLYWSPIPSQVKRVETWSSGREIAFIACLPSLLFYRLSPLQWKELLVLPIVAKLLLYESIVLSVLSSNNVTSSDIAFPCLIGGDSS